MPTENELKIAIVDDIVKDRAEITDCVGDILRQAMILYSIEAFSHAKSLLEVIRSGKAYHLFLLDVMMDEIDGMELARLLRKQQRNTDIIFISVNRDMALCGYEVDAARYLAKPIDRSKMKEALLHCYDKWQTKKEILLPTNEGQHRTSFTDIQFVEAFDRGTRFFLTNSTIDTKLKFSDVDRMLPKSLFLSCHRAYIVNVTHVMRIRPCEFELHSGALVPISKHRYYEVNRQFVDRITD